MSIVLPKYTFSHVPLYWLPSYPVLIYTGNSVQKGRTLTAVKLTEQYPNQTNYSCKDLPQTSLKMAQTITCARCGRVVIIFGKQITIFLNSQFDFQRMAVLSTLLSRCAPLSKPLTSVVTQVRVLEMTNSPNAQLSKFKDLVLKGGGIRES